MINHRPSAKLHHISGIFRLTDQNPHGLRINKELVLCGHLLIIKIRPDLQGFRNIYGGPPPSAVWEKTFAEPIYADSCNQSPSTAIRYLHVKKDNRQRNHDQRKYREIDERLNPGNQE